MEAELYFLSVDGTYLVFDVSTLLLVRKYLVIGSTPFVSVFTSRYGRPQHHLQHSRRHNLRVYNDIQQSCGTVVSICQLNTGDGNLMEL